MQAGGLGHPGNRGWERAVWSKLRHVSEGGMLSGKADAGPRAHRAVAGILFGHLSGPSGRTGLKRAEARVLRGIPLGRENQCPLATCHKPDADPKSEFLDNAHV